MATKRINRTFLTEEDKRARSRGGNLKLPQPHYVQPNTGAGPGSGDTGARLTADYDPTKARMKSWNVTEDIRGGI